MRCDVMWIFYIISDFNGKYSKVTFTNVKQQYEYKYK